MDSASFSTLIRQARAGDQDAATQLVREFEPALRRQIRMQLTNPWMRRTSDTSDLLQSVLGNFFIRLAAGQFELDRPEQMAKLLNAMATNRIRNLVRSARVRAPAGTPVTEPVAPDSSPSGVIARRELVKRVRDLLSDEELTIADLRNSGLSWEDVANKTGGNAEAIRKQFTRAMNRVGLQFEGDVIDP